MKTFFKMAVVTALASCAFTPAMANTQCGNRENIISTLEKEYGETRRSAGLANNNGLLEVYASLESGSWTITLTMPNGMMCLVAAGQSYEEYPVPPNL
jgi:hypothetical protein